MHNPPQDGEDGVVAVQRSSGVIRLLILATQEDEASKIVQEAAVDRAHMFMPALLVINSGPGSLDAAI
jgi:hypothetical protein